MEIVVTLFWIAVILCMTYSAGKMSANSELREEVRKLKNELLELYEKKRTIEEELKEKSPIAQAIKANIELKYRKRYEEKRAKFKATYDDRPVRFLFCVPEYISMADGGFPVVKGWKREDYWVYTAQEGNCFHKKNCSTLHYWGKPVRIWDASMSRYPCSICKPKTADFSWYTQFLRVKEEAAYYGFKVLVENGVVHLEDTSTRKAGFNQ